jgi:hypothetical protein
LGYLSSGVVDQLNERFAAMSIEELLAELANPKNINCLVRLEAARELSKRKLSAETQREAVVKLRASEVAPAIQQLYERLLLGN